VSITSQDLENIKNGRKARAISRKGAHGKLVTACSNLLTAAGVFHSITQLMPVKTETGYRAARGLKGWPDISAIKEVDIDGVGAGIFWGIEIKVTPDTLSDDQKAVQKEIELRGGYYNVVYDDVTDLARILRENK